MKINALFRQRSWGSWQIFKNYSSLFYFSIVSFLVPISIDFSSSFGDYFLWGFFNFCWWPRGHKKNYGPNQLLLSLLLSVFSQREKEIQNSHETRQQIEFGWNRAKQWETDCSGPFWGKNYGTFQQKECGPFQGKDRPFQVKCCLSAWEKHCGPFQGKDWLPVRGRIVGHFGGRIIGHFAKRIATHFRGNYIKSFLVRVMGTYNINRDKCGIMSWTRGWINDTQRFPNGESNIEFWAW